MGAVDNPLLSLLAPPDSPGLVEWRAARLVRDGWPSKQVVISHQPPAQVPTDLWALNQHQGYHLWFGPALRRRRGSKAEDLLLTWALWADLDGKQYAGGKVEALERLRAAVPQPSAIVDSGHGFHAYYLLASPLELLTADALARLKSMLRALAVLLDSDSVCDPPRMMRVPGTLNTKLCGPQASGRPVPCELLELRSGLHYHLEYLEAALPLAELEPEPPAAQRAVKLQVPTPAKRKRGRPSSGVTVKDLRSLEPWARRLIRQGRASAPRRYPSRSEADLAAAGAMVRADWPDARILAAFNRADWRIGERFRMLLEHEGKRRALEYLEATISKAHRGAMERPL